MTPPLASREKEANLILTGWGYSEYVAAAAAAIRAVGREATVFGMSRRRLPEFLGQVAPDSAWSNVFILGVSLSGNPAALADALRGLRQRGTRVVWISSMKVPEEIAPVLGDLLETFVRETSLLAAVGEFFTIDVSDLLPVAAPTAEPPPRIASLLDLVEAAKFAYRNYQDESVYGEVARAIAKGQGEASWPEPLKRLVSHYGRYGGRELIGRSPQIVELRERIGKIAAFPDARVLILGESGTGKETVAQLLHTKSPRSNEAFVAFNCASVTPSLLESRFFGHEKGAFTGADRQTKGLFEHANGGTLFLDEIGEMTLETQTVLLRVLEGGRFMRVGGTEEIQVDVRLVTATNRDLPRRVREGKFRADLYHRLNVVQIRIPSLRERKDDIEPIANAWWRKHHGNKTLAPAQVAALLEYDYPGNVRELLNLLDRATVLGEEDFTRLMREHREMNEGLLDLPGADEASDMPDDMEAAMSAHVRKVFEKYGRNASRAAQALGVSRNTLRKYLDASPAT